mmetsp:Transcript_45678/g.102509  ORF Transcript_45678/g.102509 Transcript_45678/m.102509 type:complete len:148 (-) Transcript_45678:763-1206(-)
MVKWVKGFIGSTEDVSLSHAASASNSWVYAFNKLSSHGSALARLYAGKLAVDVATPEYLAASDHWAASWLTLAERAENTALAWAAPFTSGKTKALSDAGRGAASRTMAWTRPGWMHIAASSSHLLPMKISYAQTWTKWCQATLASLI